MSYPVRRAVIPAAGFGTRFLPISKSVPKEMLPIVDTPVIQHVVEEAVAAGIEQVVVVNGRHRNALDEHFDHAYELEHVLERRGDTDKLEQLVAIANLAQVVSVRQKRAAGLGHAVSCAREIVDNEPVAVLLPDDLFEGNRGHGISQLLDAFATCGGAGVVGVTQVPEGEQDKYGIVDGNMDESGYIKVDQLVEKPAPGSAPSRWAVIGRYVFPPEIWNALSSTEAGYGGEIQLTDAMAKLVDTGPGLYAIPIQGKRYDTGDKLGFLQANLAFALKRSELRAPLLKIMRDLLDG